MQAKAAAVPAKMKAAARIEVFMTYPFIKLDCKRRFRPEKEPCRSANEPHETVRSISQWPVDKAKMWRREEFVGGVLGSNGRRGA